MLRNNAPKYCLVFFSWGDFFVASARQSPASLQTRERCAMRKTCGWLLSVVAVVVLTGAVARAADEEKSAPKYTIKEVMEKAHKAGLLKKVVADQASQEEKLALLDLYISLVESKPSKGTPESWQGKAGIVALAAAKVAVGRDGATAQLKEAVNCAACHSAHK